MSDDLQNLFGIYTDNYNQINYNQLANDYCVNVDDERRPQPYISFVPSNGELNNQLANFISVNRQIPLCPSLRIINSDDNDAFKNEAKLQFETILDSGRNLYNSSCYSLENSDYEICNTSFNNPNPLANVDPVVGYTDLNYTYRTDTDTDTDEARKKARRRAGKLNFLMSQKRLLKKQQDACEQENNTLPCKPIYTMLDNNFPPEDGQLLSTSATTCMPYVESWNDGACPSYCNNPPFWKNPFSWKNYLPCLKTPIREFCDKLITSLEWSIGKAATEICTTALIVIYNAFMAANLEDGMGEVGEALQPFVDAVFNVICTYFKANFTQDFLTSGHCNQLGNVSLDSILNAIRPSACYKAWRLNLLNKMSNAWCQILVHPTDAENIIKRVLTPTRWNCPTR